VQTGEKTDERTGQHSADNLFHRQFAQALSVRDNGCRTKTEALHLARPFSHEI
jgi:hypothetical protein